MRKYLTERNIWKKGEFCEESGIQVSVRLSVLTLVTNRSVGAAETSIRTKLPLVNSCIMKQTRPVYSYSYHQISGIQTFRDKDSS